MEWIQNLLDSGTTPIVTAFLLGLLTAISPCPLATNITAIGFISKDIENRHRVFLNGVLYTIGRLVAYVGLAMVIVPLLREGSSIYAVQKAISNYGELLIAPALILIGLFMLLKDRISLPGFGFSGDAENLSGRGWWSALLLGVLFAMAFCPTSGVFYFGMLMPLSAAEAESYLLPIIFAVATGLPVVIVAWILAYSVSGIGRFYKNIQIFQKWMNLIIAILFIAVGVYYAVTYWI